MSSAGMYVGQLDQQAVLTDPHMKRVERLARIELRLGEIALTRRRHAQIDERVTKLGRAEPTLTDTT